MNTLTYQKDDLIIETFPIGSFACNCSLIYDRTSNEALVIDPGNDWPALKQMIDKRGLKVQKLLHTHAHFDHIGQSDECKKHTGAGLYLHKDDLFLYQALEQQGMFFGMRLAPPGQVDGYLQDDEQFGLSGQSLKNFQIGRAHV